MFRRTIAFLFAAAAMLVVGSRVSGVEKTTALRSDARPPTIDPRAIASHIRFLASDALEGRETGMRGFEVAAEYVRAQFAAIGLTPLHDDWFQRFALRAAALDEKASSLSINGTPLVIRKDFLLRPDFARENVSVDASLVLAGFGVTAPELHHDDYAGIDAHGKIVVVLSGAPKPFPSDQRAYYSSSDVKRQNAAAHGVVGMLTISTTTDEARSPFEKRAKQSGILPMTYLDSSGKPVDVIEAIAGSASLSKQTAESLFANASVPLDHVLADAENGVAHSFALPGTASIKTVTRFSEVRSENIIGVLRGSDPALRDEYVVVSAHLDHLGNHPQADGSDGLYNGAYDNGSGIASLIEIARALAAGPRPKRSVLFLALTGEEKGEQGSEYFVHFPPVPARQIVADVNMDMFLMIYPVADLVPLGGEHTSMGAMAAVAAHASGFEVSPDPYPEEVRFIRSDQYSFVKAGIPAIHLKPGNKSSDPNVDGAKMTRDWLRNIYHSPRDDMSQRFDFASGARYAETNLRLVRAIANAAQRPAWTAGDFFGDTFGRGGRKATITLRTP
jgi:Zn-dependent M28 family amino/carboxypeptidase